MYFDELPLDDAVLDAIDSMNFDKCTPIQAKSIGPLLDGRDLIGIAQTGTGKTAAYLIPILNHLNSGKYPSNSINCLIMSPTRELAQQIDQQVEGFSYYMPVSSYAVYGGNDGIRFEQERKGLTLGADIIVATPGRLLSHLTTGHIDLSKVSFFVLDEADRMLDMGFYDDIMKIVSYLPKNRQTILFSATMPSNIQTLANNILNNPVEVKIAISKPSDNILQHVYVCHEGMKDKLVKHILSSDDCNDRVIMFVSKKSKVKELARTLKIENKTIGAMHSDLTQPERDKIMYDFRNHHINILIATDIVSRGIDIDDIQLVINYDSPHDPEDYVHRIGRTARANRTGCAITLITPSDIYSLKKIEKLIGKSIDELALPHGCGERPSLETKQIKSHKYYANSNRHRKQQPKGRCFSGKERRSTPRDGKRSTSSSEN